MDGPIGPGPANLARQFGPWFGWFCGTVSPPRRTPGRHGFLGKSGGPSAAGAGKRKRGPLVPEVLPRANPGGETARARKFLSHSLLPGSLGRPGGGRGTPPGVDLSNYRLFPRSPKPQNPPVEPARPGIGLGAGPFVNPRLESIYQTTPLPPQRSLGVAIFPPPGVRPRLIQHPRGFNRDSDRASSMGRTGAPAPPGGVFRRPKCGCFVRELKIWAYRPRTENSFGCLPIGRPGGPCPPRTRPPSNSRALFWRRCPPRKYFRPIRPLGRPSLTGRRHTTARVVRGAPKLLADSHQGAAAPARKEQHIFSEFMRGLEQRFGNFLR